MSVQLKPPAAEADTQVRTAPLPRWTVPAAIGGGVILYLAFLGVAGLAEPDEARYAEIAREMLQLRDFITPHLNFVAYFEKPPLLYWLTALAEHLLGPSEMGVRLLPAFCGLATIWMTYALARDMFGRRLARVAAVILATSPLFFVISQIIILDMPLTAAVTAAVTCFWFAYTRPQQQARWYRAMYVSVALGILIKGPIAAVLPGMAVLAFIAARWRWRTVLDLLRLDGIALAAAIAVPWFVLVSLRNPDFPWFFFVHEHLQRYATSHEHPGPWWYYLPTLLAGLAPWSLVALADPSTLRPPADTRRRDGYTLCVAWAATTLLFFSVSISKLGTYVVPLFPPAAVLLAIGVLGQLRRGQGRGLRLAAWALRALAVGCAIATLVVPLAWSDDRAPMLSVRLLLGALVFGGGGAWMMKLLDRCRLRDALLLLCATTALFLAIAISGRGVATNYRRLARVAAAAAGPDDVMLSYAQYVQGLPFYTGRRVVSVLWWGELDFGRQRGDQAAYFWPKDEQLIEAWHGPRRLFLVLNAADLERLRPSLQPEPIIIAHQGKKVLVTNRAR